MIDLRKLGLAAALVLAGSLPIMACAQTPSQAEANARFAIVARLEAKPGKEAELADFLRSGRQIVEDEPGTNTWYAVRVSPRVFAIFDTFPTEAARQAHLNGKIPQALTKVAPDLLASPPVIETADVLAAKIPK